jgi:hypothetical protein
MKNFYSGLKKASDGRHDQALGMGDGQVGYEET